MTHALVTGASGFIGSHLVRALSESGAEISCLVREHSDCSRLVPYNPRLIIGDVTDGDSLKRAFRGIDVVYHLAGTTKWLWPHELELANIEGVRNVARTCANQSHPPTLIHISSCWARRIVMD